MIRAVPPPKLGRPPAVIRISEASKGGMKVGSLDRDFYFGITPPTLIPPVEAPEDWGLRPGYRSGVNTLIGIPYNDPLALKALHYK